MKNKIISIGFVLILITVFILNIALPDIDITYSERRKLTKFPKITMETIKNRELVDNFEQYTLDQFPFREQFRSIKAFTDLKIFNKQESNNLYLKNGYIFKLDYPLEDKKINGFIKKINKIDNQYFKDANVYYTIIPDKNYFINDSHLTYDYDYLYKQVQDNLNSHMKYINIKDSLSLEDYYYTDTHWKQENLPKIANILAKEMGVTISNDYVINEYHPFYGVYYGQLGLKTKTDNIKYLTNKIINEAILDDKESKTTSIYELSSLGGMDSYDVYLSGSTYFETITNPNSTNDKELIIFRDSFASSITPLLIEGYSKIYLVDTRYMSPQLLPTLMEITNQDVLFMYSTLVVNSSEILRN